MWGNSTFLIWWLWELNEIAHGIYLVHGLVCSKLRKSLSLHILSVSGTVLSAMNKVEPLTKRQRRLQWTVALSSRTSFAFLQGLWAGPLLEGIFKSPFSYILALLTDYSCHLFRKTFSGLQPLQSHLPVFPNFLHSTYHFLNLYSLLTCSLPFSPARM